MIIAQQDYNQKPLAIQHGALLLWGTLAGMYWKEDDVCQVYQLHDFIALVYCGTDQQHVSHIATFSMGPVALG